MLLLGGVLLLNAALFPRFNYLGMFTNTIFMRKQSCLTKKKKSISCHNGMDTLSLRSFGRFPNLGLCIRGENTYPATFNLDDST